MEWIALGLVLVLLLAGVGAWWTWSRRRDTRRLAATVLLPYRGEPSVHVTPTRTSPDDLALLALAYCARMHWLMLLDPEPGQRLLGTWLTSASLHWRDRAERLLDAMPELADVREHVGAGALTPVGERFDIQLHRGWNSRHPLWVDTTTPLRGLAVNRPLSVLLLLDHARQLLPAPWRGRLGRALDAWLDAVGPVPRGDATPRTLLDRYRAVATAWQLTAGSDTPR
jgi:hypothetical protein